MTETMAAQVLPIAQIGEPVLRKPAALIEPGELAGEEMQRFIDSLIATMRHACGAGLAANQVFVAKRVCVMEVGDNPRYPYKPNIPLTVLVNPVLTPLGDETFDSYEGCLSVPNLRGVVKRPVGVRVDALDRFGQALTREVWGLSAGTYFHECDHLDGKLFVDRVEDTKTLCTWEAFDAHHKAGFVERAEALVARFGA
ncbi:MAG: peptide deformylase [Polyangiales bacterium]